MAKILVIDDRAVNRQFMVSLLGYQHHELLEASDGVQGLQLARDQRPDLIISDVLMPTMDGYEFVRRLRQEPKISSTPVVFSTAHYLSQESQALAHKCGITSIIFKPCEPQAVLEIVGTALANKAEQVAVSTSDVSLEQEHLQLLTNKLAEKNDEVRSAHAKLAAVLELSTDLAQERDPAKLLDRYCSVAREVIGARWTLVVLLDNPRQTVEYFGVVGLNLEDSPQLRSSFVQGCVFEELMEAGHPICFGDLTATSQSIRLPENLPPVESILITPLEIRGHLSGWLCLADKLGLTSFTENDLKLANALAAKMAVSYDNAQLYKDSVTHAARLQEEISQRTNAERELSRSQARLAGIIDAAMDSIITIDDDQRIVMFNKAAESMFRCKTSEVVGQNLDRFIPARFRESHSADISEFGETGVNTRAMAATHAVNGIRADGEEFPAEASISQIEVGGGKLYTVIMRDITERKRAEQALTASEAEMRALFSSMTDSILVLDVNGRHLKIAPTNAHQPQAPANERIGRTVHQIFPPTTADLFLSQIHRALETGETQRVEYNLAISNSEYWYDASVSPLNERSVIWIERDITERKQLELQLLQSQKMEAIGRLAGGVAHDFNNLLTVINGYSELALRRTPLGSSFHGYLEEIRKAGERAANLTRQLLAFGRKQMLQPLALNLNDVVADMNKMLQRLVGEDIQFTAKFDPELKKIKADPGQIEQVLMNLMVNAKDAMPKGGQLIITTANTAIESDHATRSIGAPQGKYVLLSVTDTGTGIDEQTKSRIFEPFFTTKEKGKGTGLGLSTVYGIVKQSCGGISVQSELGKGTSFNIYLPAIGEGEPQGEVSTSEGTVPGGSETILLVEDEDTVRGLASRILEEAGYKVLSTGRGSDAVRLCREFSDAIHLLLTDVVMPEASGKEIADLVTSERSLTRVLFMSGYTDEAIVDHGIVDSTVHFIQKPFTPTALIKKVRDVLDDPALKSVI